MKDYRQAIKLNTKWAEGSFKTDIPADPLYLFALAEHFALSKNFDKAIQIQERAINLKLEDNTTENISDFREQLECYKSHIICPNNKL